MSPSFTLLIVSLMTINAQVQQLLNSFCFCHKGCAMSGLIADAKTLIDKARVETQVRMPSIL